MLPPSVPVTYGTVPYDSVGYGTVVGRRRRSAERRAELPDQLEVALVLSGVRMAPGKRIRLSGRLVVEVVRVAEPGTHLDVAAELFGEQLRALQLVYADRRGHWPWDSRFRGGRGGQPVLGVRAKQAA